MTHSLHHPDDSATSPAESSPMHPAMQADATRRLSAWVILLVCVIITGAFAFSAESWIGLAEVTGFRSAADAGDVVLRLSWVLPIAVDGYLCLTTWLFLTARPGSSLRTYSGWSVLVVVVLSVVAQGVYHGLDARGVDVARAWPLVVLVGGLPPGLLASSVHLLSIYLHHRSEPIRPIREVDAPAPPAPMAEPTAPIPRPEVAEPWRPEVDADPPIQPDAESPTPAVPMPSSSRAASPPTTRRLTVVGSRRRTSRTRREIDDATVADAIRDHVLAQRRLGLEPVQREMVRLVQQRTGVGVGQRRCITVAATIRNSDSAADPDDKESEAV